MCPGWNTHTASSPQSLNPKRGKPIHLPTVPSFQGRYTRTTNKHPPIHPSPAVPDKQVELELDPRKHLVDSLVAVNPVALARSPLVYLGKCLLLMGGFSFFSNLGHPSFEIRGTKRSERSHSYLMEYRILIVTKWFIWWLPAATS